MFIQPGDVAGAHHDVGHADGLGPEHSDDSISEEEEDEHDHGGHPFEDDEAALLEDELHMMEQELNGQPQEVGDAGSWAVLFSEVHWWVTIVHSASLYFAYQVVGIAVAAQQGCEAGLVVSGRGHITVCCVQCCSAACSTFRRWPRRSSFAQVAAWL